MTNHHHFNLNSAISLHPLPQIAISHDGYRSGRGTPDSHTPRSPERAQIERFKNGSSTAIEAEDALSDSADPVRRTGSAIIHSSDEEDVERGSPVREGQDPFNFTSRIKSPDEIANIRTSISRRNSTFSTIAPSRDAIRARKVKDFYEGQNENIERLLKPVDEHRRQAKEESESNKLQYRIAVIGSFAANIILAGLQLYGAVSSGSLSLFTTMADALFDPLSNLTLILCHRAVKRVDGRKFPAGKARIENAGNIAFCHLMCAVSLILIVTSAKEIADGAPVVNGVKSQTSPLHLPSIIAVATAFTVKFALFLYCWGLRNKYSQVRILWEDHRNDLIINGAGLATSLMGSKVRWWIDPMGAIILSVLIATLWLNTSFKEFNLLIGRTADAATLQLLTYISVTHSKRIIALDTVRAWYSGPRLIVEVDIVMDPNESLRETHDLAEELQTKLESLPDIERAYVHVDYETEHAPEHFLKKEL